MEENFKIPKRPLKRCFDIVISIFFLLILSPIIALIVLLLLLQQIFIPTTGGKVLEPELRISQGKEFFIYKFKIKHKNSEKLTPVGRAIKQIYLDELPQLLNILKGEMSLVGPRPHALAHYERDLSEGVISAKYIRAGLLGLVQGSKGHDDLREKFGELTPSNHPNATWCTHISNHYFTMYREASHWELMKYDLWIAYRGIRVVFEAKGI